MKTFSALLALCAGNSPVTGEFPSQRPVTRSFDVLICFEARCKCGVGFIHTQLASSYANAPQQLASSRSRVGFITRDFHALISRQHSQTNRRGLYTLFLTSKSRCMQKISSVDALLSTQNVLSRSGRFGGGHTGWSQLQLASSVSPLWQCTFYISRSLSSKAAKDAHPIAHP